MIEIVNMRKEKPRAPYDVRVDRASILGSPFVLKNEKDRDKICDKYDVYFQKQIIDNKEFLSALKEILYIYTQYKKVRLFCWCVPKRCHAETIKKWLQTKIKE